MCVLFYFISFYFRGAFTIYNSELLYSFRLLYVMNFPKGGEAEKRPHIRRSNEVLILVSRHA